MPIIDRYRKIQTNLAKKKEQKQNLQLSEEQARLATEKFGAEKVNKALETVQSAGVTVEPTKMPAENPPISSETPPQAPITPQPVETPVIEPLKQETPVQVGEKATEVAKEAKKPGEVAKTPVIGEKSTEKGVTPTIPKGFEYGSMIDSKTGLPQLVNTAEVKRQKELKKNASIYTSGQSLYDGIKSGNILPGTDQFSDLQQANPQVFAEYEAIKKQEQESEKIKNVGRMIMGDPIETKPSSTLQDLLDKVSSGLDEDIGAMYKNMVTNNEEYVAANTKVTDLSNQLTTVENQMNQIGVDLRKTITGETPESVIASKIAREAKPLLDKATYLQNQLEIAQADANRIMADNKGMFEIQMADRADKRNLAFQLYGTINAAEIRAEDVARADAELQQKMEQAKTEQEYLQYKDERDYNLKVAEAIAKQEQSDRDYQLKEFEATKQKASDYLQFKTINEDGTETISYRNPMTGETLSAPEVFGNTPSIQSTGSAPIASMLGAFSPEGQALLTAPDGTVIPTRLNEVSAQNASIRGKECAEYVNDIYGTKIGSTYQDKLDVCTETTGGVGSIAAWQPKGSGSYGHVGVIVDEDANNYYIKSSNYTPGTITTVPVPKASIKNFYTPPEIKDAQGSLAETQKQNMLANANPTLLAYAEEYKSTGKIPAGIPKGGFGKVSALAKALPKQKGEIFDATTGVTPQGDGEFMKGISSLYSVSELANQLLELDKQRIGGVAAGALGKVFGSSNQSRYLALRNQIVDLLSRARSGAALTTTEEKRYSDMLPGRWSESFFLGTDSEQAITNFIDNIKADLNNKISTKGWKIEGFEPELTY